MTSDGARFDTSIQSIWGIWPTVPNLWSYSSLKQIEECPRRWMLSRADYPDVWERHGYPPLPRGSALFGEVVHLVVERVTKAMLIAGITSVTDIGVADLFGELGGWNALVMDAIEAKLSDFDGNPRVSTVLLDRTRQDLVRRISGAVDQAKDFLSSGEILVSHGEGFAEHQVSSRGESGTRPPVGKGTHVERVLTCKSIQLMGKIDILIVDDAQVSITDIKTGVEDDNHVDQVRTYALLWHLDRESNPDGRNVTHLSLAYPGSEKTIPPPSAGELQSLEAETKERIRNAESVVKNRRPEAFPSVEKCGFCQVKHLCEAFWASQLPSWKDVAVGDWIDIEAEVIGSSGSRNWQLQTYGGDSVQILLQTGQMELSLPVGARIRLLGVQRATDVEGLSSLVLSMGSRTEWFVVSDRN